MKQLFKTQRGYNLKIEIIKDFISFYLVNPNGFMLSDKVEPFNSKEQDEEGESPFYWIPITEWIASYYNNHPLTNFSCQDTMFEKRWFTKEMNEFINNNLIKN